MRYFQKGFNYSQDGQGNRLVYHLQGCNMKCKWCSNPQSMDINEKDGVTEISAEQLLSEAILCKPMFFDGGGVTFTGGEPTLLLDELKATLHLLKENGINTAIETNGTSKRLEELFELVDFLIMDIKHIDRESHMKYTGVYNDTILDNFGKICKEAKEAHIRIPLVNGVNNNPSQFADFFAKHDTSKITFEILAYHEYGKQRWKEKYEIENGFVTQKDIDEFHRIFSQCGLKIKNT